MASTIQVRVDDELKRKSDSLFKDLGTDTTTAIRIFLTQAVAANGFPFEIKRCTEKTGRCEGTRRAGSMYRRRCICGRYEDKIWHIRFL